MDLSFIEASKLVLAQDGRLTYVEVKAAAEALQEFCKPVTDPRHVPSPAVIKLAIDGAKNAN